MYVFSREVSTALDAVKSQYVYDNEAEQSQPQVKYNTLAIIAIERSETPVIPLESFETHGTNLFITFQYVRAGLFQF